ncbi:MAG: hypothetical protein E6I26_14370 [Chloroflexi bacterium]|nr:MAG: hypothetical protein E6I26_14370 [Chloroflexota bacterium]
MATPTNARIVTRSGSTPAVLTVDDESADGLLVLYVNGVRRTPDELADGAYLEVDDPELADIAALAGYFVEAPTTWKRRMSRYGARFIGVAGILCAIGSLYWIVRAVFALDLLGAVAWAGLGLFIGLIGIGYLAYGEQGLLGDIASRRLSNRHIREDLKRAVGRGPRKGASGRSASGRRDGPPKS